MTSAPTQTDSRCWAGRRGLRGVGGATGPSDVICLRPSRPSSSSCSSASHSWRRAITRLHTTHPQTTKGAAPPLPPGARSALCASPTPRDRHNHARVGLKMPADRMSSAPTTHNHGVVTRGNFLGPWTVSPNPPPPPPPRPPGPPPKVGPCVGSAGSPGWAVHNHTGGGGPDFTTFPAHGLGEADVDACRAHCCASPYCVSIVLHVNKGTTKCYLNPNLPGLQPYSRPDTLLAYVKRGPAE
jgi:hypothetical protein